VSVTLDELRGNFPTDALPPVRLVELLAFQESSPDWYSGRFEISAWQHGDAAWFDGDVEAAKQFAVFGNGSDGSLYALWLYPGRSVMDAPVVFLGSEGVDCSVIATNFDDFLALLAVGADELGFEAAWGDITSGELPAERQGDFRAWLQERYGISAPPEPMDVVRRARAEHPDLEAWIREWQEKRYGSDGAA
jgi:hypothetical protein